jgi:hypothetical protein
MEIWREREREREREGRDISHYSTAIKANI